MASSPMTPQQMRIGALRRFATAITALTVLGHAVLGFEQSYAQVLVALATAYSLELVLESLDAWAEGRRPWYRGGVLELVDFLLPAHITALACSMLLYANERLWPVAFAVAVATGSKYVLRVWVGNRRRHFLNPSNTGIALTLLLFPWVGIAPPYQFTENTAGGWDWVLPALFVVVGTALNARYTRKLPLICGWLGAFLLQAVLRSWYFETPVIAALAPMTGVAFLLFTFYMVTDPATTPFKPVNQVIFGASVAGVYAALMMAHIVFGLFFALLVVCTVRGTCLWLASLAPVGQPAPPARPALGKEAAS